MLTDAQRLILDKSAPIGTGCRIWLQAHDRDGYTRVRFQGKRYGSHRLAYEAFVGPIPEGFDIHHECGYADCVNPLHLTALSKEDHRALHADVEALCASNACRVYYRQ